MFDKQAGEPPTPGLLVSIAGEFLMSMPDENVDDDLAVAPNVERHILVHTPSQTVALFAKRFRWMIAVILVALLAALIVLLTGGVSHHAPTQVGSGARSLSVDRHTSTAYWTAAPSRSGHVPIGGTTCLV